MPEPPEEHPPQPPQEPPREPPRESPSQRREDDSDRVLDEAFKLGEGEEAWLEIARRASRPVESLGNLGPYSLLEELGRGGQGEVYKAVQPGTGRLVALKRLAAGGLRIGSRAAERFSREVDAATRLSHPNVVTVFAAEVIEGHAVLVMEWIDGTTIDQWADAQWSDPEASDRAKLARVLGAFAAACDGVAHAHQRGVIHRDLKPSNIMIGRNALPRVLDFGVAKVLEEWRGADATARATAWTATGFAGTPAYASPEQLGRGAGAADTRADVYALGVILYRLLSGEEAFAGRAGLADLLDAVRRGPSRRPSQIRKAVGREADWIVQRAMAPEPAHRYQSVDALADDVRRLLEGRAVLAHPPSVVYTAWRAVRRRPWTWGSLVAAVAAITTLSVVATVQATRLGRQARDLNTALQVANEQRAVAERQEERQRVLSNRLLHAMMGAANDDRFVVNRDQNPVAVLRGLVAQIGPEDSDDTVAELHMRLAFALVQERRWAEVEAQLARAQEVSDRIDKPDSERSLRIATRRVGALRELKRYDDALKYANEAIANARRGESTPFIAGLYWEIMYILGEMNAPLHEIRACGDSLIAATDAFPDRFSDRARAREEVSGMILPRGAISEAEVLLREALAIPRNTGGVHFISDVSVSRFNHSLAFVLLRQGRWAEAEPPARFAADFRLRHETARGGRGYRFVVLHAAILHRLGRFSEATPRWELALIRPLSDSRPDERAIARFRLRLAAARLALGDEQAGRVVLAQTLSLGRIANPEHAEVRARIASVEAALRAAEWQVDERIKEALEDRHWLADPLFDQYHGPVTDSPALPGRSDAQPVEVDLRSQG
ncbi:MAG: serine/threonine protein kinase [Phycisphaeraceae bacterium]|nr:serine/threonine protein kinase [Phycisphaeraceae bacterium]